MSFKKTDGGIMLFAVFGLICAFGFIFALVTFRSPSPFLQAVLSIILGGLISLLVSLYFYKRQEVENIREAEEREKQFVALVNRYKDVVEKIDDQADKREVEFNRRSRQFEDQIRYKTRLSRFEKFLDVNENWDIDLNQEEPEFQFLNYNLSAVFTNRTKSTFFGLKSYSIDTMKKAPLLNRYSFRINEVPPGKGFEIFLDTMQFNPDGIILVWEQGRVTQGVLSQERVIRMQIIRFDPKLSMRGYFDPNFYSYDLSGQFVNKSIILPSDLVDEANRQAGTGDEKIRKSIDENVSWIINYYAAYKESQDSEQKKSFCPPENLTQQELEKYVKENFDRDFSALPPYERDF